MPQYPRIDNAGGLWKLPEIANYRIGGYWPDVGCRALFGGGRTPSESDVIDYIEIVSTGNATDFGNLQSTKYNMGTGSNELVEHFLVVMITIQLNRMLLII